MTFIKPLWPAPSWVKAISTTREGGFSLPPFDGLNLGAHVGDNAEHVEKNRAWLAKEIKIPAPVTWLNQVHGVEAITLPYKGHDPLFSAQYPWISPPNADASFTQEKETVCIVMTADCLPVLFCDDQGTQVAAAHAGWKGLLDGVLEKTLNKFKTPHNIMAWLGPAIGANSFEVGGEVRAQFLKKDEGAHVAFKPHTKTSHKDRWLADIYLLAKRRLHLAGVTMIYGGEYCTFSDASRFFSYRRDNITGRQASFIWIAKDPLF